jgi:chemotaxis protein CheC
MSSQYTEVHLDALREVMNTGSGSAAADLGEMLERSVNINVPRVVLTDIAEAVEIFGGADGGVATVIGVPLTGDLQGVVTIVLQGSAPSSLCEWLGCPYPSEFATSALQEIGNTLASSYTEILAEMAGLKVEMHPPDLATDLLPALLPAIAAGVDDAADEVLLIDSELVVSGENCNLSVLLLSRRDCIAALLENLGLSL